jgi:F-type H+-transporting ATPase subunit b
MPQISQLAETFASQLFWVLVTFGLVFLVVGVGILPRVLSTVDERDNTVAGDLAAAEAARRSADESEERWRTQENAARAAVQSRIAEARAKGAAAAEQTLAASNADAEARLTAAEARIAEASKAAMTEIETVAADAARDIVARLSGADVTAAEAQNAVKAVLHG